MGGAACDREELCTDSDKVSSPSDKNCGHQSDLKLYIRLRERERNSRFEHCVEGWCFEMCAMTERMMVQSWLRTYLVEHNQKYLMLKFGVHRSKHRGVGRCAS